MRSMIATLGVKPDYSWRWELAAFEGPCREEFVPGAYLVQRGGCPPPYLLGVTLSLPHRNDIAPSRVGLDDPRVPIPVSRESVKVT